jgi:lipopolysaccharide transport protein LptA
MSHNAYMRSIGAETAAITRPVTPRFLRCARNGSRGLCACVALLLIQAWIVHDSAAQAIKIRPIKNFKVPDYYPNVTTGATNRMKSLLTGTEARLNQDGRVVVKQARIENYSGSGQTQMVVRVAECLFDNKSNSAFSTNTLQFQTGDGKFSLEGVGFNWDRTNSNLIISNQVHTLISRPLVQASSPTSLRPAEADGQIEITSEGLEYLAEPKQATWQRNVRVKEPRLTMTCDLVTAKFTGEDTKPESPTTKPDDPTKSDNPTAKLESLVAETNVAILVTLSNEVIAARCDKVVYLAGPETLVLSGEKPILESETHHLRILSPDIVMNLTNKMLSATAPVKTIMPRGALEKWSEPRLAPPGVGPNAPAADANLEVSAEQFEFASESKLAVWRGNVRATDPSLNLTCQRLSARLAGDTAKQENSAATLANLVAETNVVITITETNGVSKTKAQCDLAVFSATNGMLVLSGPNTTLESESAHLRLWSPLITMDVTNKTLKAAAPVRTRIPSGAFGKLTEVGSPSTPARPDPAAGSTDESIELLADAFDFDSQTGLAVWRRNVRGQNPKLNLTCELLTASTTSNKLDRIIAETNVLLKITETNGVSTARGDKAVYSTSTETLVLSGTDPMIESESSHFQLRASLITYDLENRKLRAEGPVRGSIQPAGLRKITDSNASPKPPEGSSPGTKP